MALHIFSLRSRPTEYSLIITHNFARNECSHSQPAEQAAE